MFRNMNVPNLCINRRGAVSVEFVLVSLVLIFFLIFLTDLFIRQATRSKLDRVAYSVAGVLRERVQLFDARETLSQQDVDQAARLAARMLSDMHTDIDLSRLQLTVEELHFTDPLRLNDASKRIKSYQRWYSGGSAQCAPPQALNQLTQLTPKGSYGRWVPLYQVTVCLPNISWYTRLLSMEQAPVLSSFAIVMLR